MTNPYDSPPASPRYSYIKATATSGTITPPSTQDHEVSHPDQSRKGEIKLIGAGPGDPDLLTMAAYKAITSWADIVLSDKLVSKEILALVSCPLFIANKDKGCQASGQQELFERATQALQQGLRVVRLKQGGKRQFPPSKGSHRPHKAFSQRTKQFSFHHRPIHFRTRWRRVLVLPPARL
jgi:uroporphyrin-III C-methyltransferase